MNLSLRLSIDRSDCINLAVTFFAAHLHKGCGGLITRAIEHDKLIASLHSHDPTGVLRFSLRQGDQTARNRQIRDKVSSCHRS